MLLKIKAIMAEVDITINGRSYRISCKDGEEERIKSLSSLINNQVQKLSEKIGQLGEARMILLASLVLLDKSDEIEKEAEKIISITSEKIEKLAKKFSNE
jgi:cell division protein ZapA